MCVEKKVEMGRGSVDLRVVGGRVRRARRADKVDLCRRASMSVFERGGGCCC